MPEIDPNTPLKEFKCAGVILSAPQPYNEGHALNANEAAVLNQTFIENLRNNFAGKINKKVEELVEKAGYTEEEAIERLPLDEIRAEFDEYVRTYEFGVRRGGSTLPLDPVEKEAWKLAKQLIRAAYQAKGLKVSDVSDEEMEEKIKKVLDVRPDIREAAKARVEAMSSVSSGLSSDLGI